MAFDYGITSKSPAWQRHRAARTAACQARDAADLAELLAMLGLDAAEGRVPPEEAPDEPPVPVPRTARPTLDPMSACRLNNLLRSTKATQTGASTTHR